METRLADWIKGSAQGDTANAILRACVHCGFCNATCPTYQLLGDELDGPRGRIYQIKQVLEGTPATRSTQLHLDRCLTCRACETTCPSGVDYGHLVDIGRSVVDSQVRRPPTERLFHWLLREGLTRRWLFGSALALGRALRWALPQPLRSKLAPRRAAGVWPLRVHARKVLLLNGCTQPAMAPSIDAATARVLDAIGVQALVDTRSGCCGALRHHLEDQPGGLANARRNIDAWWPQLQSGAVEAIVINASACALMVREYGWLLRADPHYAASARRVSEATRDLVEFLGPEVPQLRRRVATPAVTRIAVQKPCTLQHGLQLKDNVDQLLAALGAQLLPVSEPHLCCGSAGTYSLLQPQLALELRERKLGHLLQAQPQMILTANIGCMAHLAAGTAVPVLHWIEWVDKAISSA
ncbi:MAG TPA: glycolate oxidase subunit GlcF [Steroidobacteraceae bacterium]